MTVGEVAQMITALAACGGVAVSLRNSRKMDQIKDGVDGLSDKRAHAAAGQATAEEKVRGLEKAALVLAETNGKHE